MADIFDAVFQPVVFHNVQFHNHGIIPEPPYAQLLRRLGLFDPIQLPPIERGRRQSSFPVVVHSAGSVQQQDESRRPFFDSDDGEPRDSRIMGPVSELLGESTKWAVGNLFGHMRDVMDHIENRVNRTAPVHKEGQTEQDTLRDAPRAPSLYQALRNDMLMNFDRLFPESAAEEKNNGYSRSYQVTTRAMPDGSIETRKVVRSSDGSEETTIIRRYSSSSVPDEASTTSTASAPSPPTSSADAAHSPAGNRSM
ncbi:hypothetical protein GQ54DRAFT_297285 [Martensiomyces pterosporus]|nr:hypothetical protein GQ54DRAFT_297285 [Martensiomyces pterosporus]